jgi:hypothetical protein
VPEPTVYPAAVLRVAPQALPDLRTALDTVLAELRPLMQRLYYDGWIREPWMDDSELPDVAELQPQGRDSR